ncbi:MAG: hypothetical protein JRC89_01885 [Deltaproteobacteria bacterium]|nr:hypothetical protein [Deltaproteobacteria bacterium]
MNDPRGSLWRKWDLHLHTPSSPDYTNKSVSNDEIVDTLLENEIAAVAITDHHLIDIDRIQGLQEIAEGKLTIFPGIEVRTDVTGKENVHLIGIFPENANIGLVWTEIQVLGLHPDVVIKKGPENVYVDFKEFCKMVHKHYGIVTIHAGRKSNTLENITNALSHKQALKKDLLKFYDVFEVGTLKDIQDYHANVLPNIPKKPPMILCSDNHNIREYTVKSWCWIKADVTFEGLKQIIREPNKRVFVGDKPNVLERLSSNPSKYMKSFYINKKPDSKLDEIWFENIKIDLNPEMAVIIGNKGNGKSALSDSIGLVGNSRNYNDFSFLNDNKFCKRRDNSKAKHFLAKVEWKSGDITPEIELHQRPGYSDIEKVKYMPQKFFEKLTNEEDESFIEELERVIFSQIEDKAGKGTLAELIEFLSQPILQQISGLKKRIQELNREIVELELLSTPEAKESIQNKTTELNRQVKGIKPPTPVPKPDKESPQIKEAILKIDELNETRTELKKKKREYEEGLSELKLKKTMLNNLLRKIDNFKADYDLSMEGFEEDLRRISLKDVKIGDIIQLCIDKEPLKKNLSLMTEEEGNLVKELDQDDEKSLAFTLEETQTKLISLQAKLDKPNKEYQEYLAKKEKSEESIAKIIGSKDKPGTIEYYKDRISYIEEQLSLEIQDKYKKRLLLSEEIFLKKEELTRIRRDLFAPISKYIAENEDLNRDFPITLEVSFRLLGFNEDFFKMINQGAIGSFRGKEDGERRLNKIIELADLNDKSSFLRFLNIILENLNIDKREGKENAEVFIQSQILSKPEKFYDFLFFLDYLDPYYELRLDNRRLSELSPGEKGYLLLLFYLFIDKDDIPLIFDQPEENLDNQSVFELLVPCIDKVKKYRQIIIVTHNPNIAVVCDAEQVIHAKINKPMKCKAIYTTGAIENPIINNKIVDVLEGTLPAFDNRDSKYDLTRKMVTE